VAKWIQAGVGGVVALGSNGEAPFVDEDEDDRVIAAARAAVPRDKVLIVGTGRESTRATIAASARAAAQGADAVLVRTPSFFKARMTPEVFVRHYTAVADATPVPVLLYNVPAVTGVNLTPDAVGRLARHPNIIGVKETGSDTAQWRPSWRRARVRRHCRLNRVLPVALRRRDGGILAALRPAGAVRELHGISRRPPPEARELQRRLTPLALDTASACRPETGWVVACRRRARGPLGP
jgi:dihydrodipicolinate synthase/N-acetylneuraminate lyase